MRNIFTGLGLVALTPLFACGGAIDVGQGAEKDARLTADLFTWDCAQEDTGGGLEEWMGVFAYEIGLEFVPDDLPEREVPSGCSYGISMFAMDELTSGEDIPGLSNEPRWRTDSDNGELLEVVQGVYLDEVFSNEFTCQRADDLIQSGVELYEAGALDGIITPEAGTIDDVTVEADYDTSTGIDFGTELTISWDATGWDGSFIQVRGVRNGIAMETLTCDTNGDDSYVIDDDIWEFLNEDLNVDTHKIYVGFYNEDEEETKDNLKVETLTRAMHVVGILED